MYENLKKLRQKLGLTQAQFGKSVGVNKTTYSNYETGIREPKSDFWKTVADTYNVSVDYLIGHTDNPVPQKTAPSEADEAIDINETMELFSQLPHESQHHVLSYMKFLNSGDNKSADK